MSKKTLEDKGQLHSPDMACYYAVHGHQGGLPTVAALMGIRPGTLQKKLSPKCDTHKLYLTDAMHIFRFTEDERILDAICAEASVLWYRPDDVPAFPGDLDLLESHSNLFSRTSDLVHGVTQALADGVIDPHEKATLNKLKFEMQKALKKLDEVSAQFEGEK